MSNEERSQGPNQEDVPELLKADESGVDQGFEPKGSPRRTARTRKRRTVTCRLQGVNPFEWLQDVLTRVRDHPPARMAELAPRQWAAARRADVGDLDQGGIDTS